MQTDPQISFQNMDPSPSVEARIRERIADLEKFYPRITTCSVVVAAPHRHGQKGQTYDVRVRIDVPGRTLAVTRDPGVDHAHEEILVAIRDSFDAMKRQLEDYARKRRGKVKQHETPAGGHVISLHPEEGYGKIETPDGRVLTEFLTPVRQTVST